MFPRVQTSTPPVTLRTRLIRTLDVAVEFATLGEYGVDEVEVGGAAVEPCSWDWPPRRAPEGHSATLRRARQRGHAFCTGV